MNTLAEIVDALREVHHIFAQLRVVEDDIHARRRIAAMDTLARVHEVLYMELNDPKEKPAEGQEEVKEEAPVEEEKKEEAAA